MVEDDGVSIEGVVKRVERETEEGFPGVEAGGQWAVSPVSIWVVSGCRLDIVKMCESKARIAR